jgi:hypothetical protein
MNVRKWIASASVIVLGTAAFVAISGSPAAASQTSCKSGGGFSWFSITANVSGDQGHVEINVYSGSSCSGRTILQGIVETYHGDSKYHVWASDGACDNYGMRVEMHGYGLSTNGCHADPQPFATVAMSSIGSPKNFWLLVHGVQNTTAYNLPPAE